MAESTDLEQLELIHNDDEDTSDHSKGEMNLDEMQLRWQQWRQKKKEEDYSDSIHSHADCSHFELDWTLELEKELEKDSGWEKWGR